LKKLQYRNARQIPYKTSSVFSCLPVKIPKIKLLRDLPLKKWREENSAVIKFLCYFLLVQKVVQKGPRKSIASMIFGLGPLLSMAAKHISSIAMPGNIL